MALRTTPNTVSPWRAVKLTAVLFIGLILLLSFFFWRADNPRVEQLRLTILENYVPDFGELLSPLARLSFIATNFQSYNDLLDENQKLRRQVQQMESWRESALQLEQTNAELRALNNLSVLPSYSYISGEVIADSGSGFSQSALINVGKRKGVEAGAPVVDGFGVIGRVTGTVDDKSRVLLLSDPTSKISALVMPERSRVILRGDNNNLLKLTPVDGGAKLTAGARVVTSGAGIFPADLLIGYITVDDNENVSVRLAAKYNSLEFARILISPEATKIDDDNLIIQPTTSPDTITTKASTEVEIEAQQ